MTATSASNPSRIHSIVRVADGDLARIIGIIGGVGRLSGSIAVTTGENTSPKSFVDHSPQRVETLTLVYPGAAVPVWTVATIRVGPNAGSPEAAYDLQLVEPDKDLNCVVFCTEGLFERLCGTICGLYCAMIPLSSSEYHYTFNCVHAIDHCAQLETLTIVGGSRKFPRWSNDPPSGIYLLPEGTGKPLETTAPGFGMSPGHGNDSSAMTVEDEDFDDMSDIEAASMQSAPSSRAATPANILPHIPPPVIARENHGSERLFHRLPPKPKIIARDGLYVYTEKRNALPDTGPIDISADFESVMDDASNPDTPNIVARSRDGGTCDNRRGIPCHECGAIVKVYVKPQWYAVIKGLDVGVKHTWSVLSACTPSDSNLVTGRLSPHLLHIPDITSAELFIGSFTLKLRRKPASLVPWMTASSSC